MERLVVSYTVDCGWDGCFDHVLPVVYESKAKFLTDFEDAVIGYWLAYQDHRKAEERWLKKKPHGTPRWAEWHAREPKLEASHEIKMGGGEFDAMNFIVSGDYSPPTVQTVDEWFGGENGPRTVAV